ncbi:MAG: GNAT family N-acetyltransferase, partial [Candidatus Binatia bacterium]
MSNPVASDPHHYAAEAILRDGSSIHIRAIRPDDGQRLIDHFGRLGAQSVYFRFFRVKKRLTDEEIVQFTQLDFIHNAALVATLGQGDDEKIIGVGRYAVVDARGPSSTPHRAEVGFAVADDYQGRGIGTLLLEHLTPIARANGITEFEADVLGENNRMLEVFAHSGFRVKRSVEEGVFHVSFPTAETEEFLEASLSRERQAAAESVRAFLNPRSVAIVGASHHPGTIGAALVTNLQRSGFTGALYPVNPNPSAIAGLPTFPSLSAVKAPIDLAVVAVPAPAVEAAVAECGRVGVRGVVVISSGFAEASESGRAAQRRLT